MSGICKFWIVDDLKTLKYRDDVLDLVRELSTLLVMLGNLRGVIFLDIGQLEHATLPTKAFYFATGLGHQVVMVFFVLSGYFVGGLVLSGLAKKTLYLGGYTAARLTRLWMVLFPALIPTFGVDLLGRFWNPDTNAGDFKDRFMSGTSHVQFAAYELLTFLGNRGFV